MQETLRHQEAFEYYYGLGHKRNCHKVAKEFAVSHNSAKKWKVNFDWKERVVLRDAEVAQGVEKQTTINIINLKAAQLKDSQELVTVLKAGLNTGTEKKKDGKRGYREITKAASSNDMVKFALAIIKAFEHQLTIVGEDKEKETINITVKVPTSE